MTAPRIGVVGVGLIGWSVILAARRAWPDAEIVGLDRGDDLHRLAGLSTIVLAVPVDAIIELLRQSSHRFGDAVVIDTGSTKQAIVEAARQAGLARFVGGHPMAGAAASGAAAAHVDLFDGKPWFLIPATPDTPALRPARHFVEALGARPFVMIDGGAEHDRVMAAVSHLPQLVACALMTVVGDAAGDQDLALAGSGLRDTTRLAASSAEMWESIVATNAAALRPLLLRMGDDLRRLADRLDDSVTIRSLLEAANRHRRRLT